jgi:hypothetical protein
MRSFCWKMLSLLVALGVSSNVAVQGASSDVGPAFRPHASATSSQINRRDKSQQARREGGKEEPLTSYKKRQATKEVIGTVRGGAVANTFANAIAGSIVMAFIEKGVKEGLKAAGIKFPAQLGGCIFLFFFLVLTDTVSPSTSTSIFEALSPGAALLAKWLPVLFVPGLVMLPLSPSIGGTSDVSTTIILCSHTTVDG